MKLTSWTTAAALAAMASAAMAQSTADGIAQYREMLQDGNPAELFEMKGEELWKQARGPKKASLEQCDLGQGPGVVKGAFTTLPRYFADTGMVQDLESRLVTCMVNLQGFDKAELIKTPFGRGEKANIIALTTWIATASKGMRFELPQAHPKEREAFEKAEKVQAKDWDGPVVLNGDRFFSCVEDLLDDLDGEDDPKYVWACRKVGLGFDADDVINNALESQEHHEDARDSITHGDVEELQALLTTWATKQRVETWWEDRTKAVILNLPQVEDQDS